MTMDILSDNERQLSVIWDTDTGRCYGYVTAGDGHREALQAFMDGLETHIAAFESYELGEMWQAFQQTVAENLPSEAEAPAPAPPETPQEAPTGPPPSTEAPTPGEAPAGPQEAPGGPTEAPTPEDPTQGPSPSPEQSTTTDGDSVRLVEVSCWNCNGSGIEAVTGSKCGVCEGTGKLHTPTAQATA